MLVDLDVDTALAFLIVKIACADEADREDSDQDEKKISTHRHCPFWHVALSCKSEPWPSGDHAVGTIACEWASARIIGVLGVTNRILVSADSVLKLALNRFNLPFRLKL
jgi:hypothetical protein